MDTSKRATELRRERREIYIKLDKAQSRNEHTELLEELRKVEEKQIQNSFISVEDIMNGLVNGL